MKSYTLLPFFLPNESSDHSSSLIELHTSDTDFIEAIVELYDTIGIPVSAEFSCYDSDAPLLDENEAIIDIEVPTHFGIRTTDYYDDPVKYVRSNDLKGLTLVPVESYKNRAALAYIRECPNKLKVALLIG